MEDYWVWGGSCIRGDDGLYHLFASRWPRRYPFFEGYIFTSEVVRAVSDAPEGPYAFQEIILPARGENYWDGRMTHNPTIHRYGDTYLLFYIGATYRGDVPDPIAMAARGCPQKEESYSSIRIGLATSESVHGPWERPDSPVLKPRKKGWDSSVVTNPAPCLSGDGSIFLYYRSNTPDGLRIGVARSPGLGSPFSRLLDRPVLKLGGGKHVEDPYIWWSGSRFEMLAKDLNGRITGENHLGLHAISPSGVNWTLSDPPKAYSRKVTWDDGSTTVQGSLERPQLLIEKGLATHLFLATADGPGGFRNATRTWNMVIPLDY